MKRSTRRLTNKSLLYALFISSTIFQPSFAVKQYYAHKLLEFLKAITTTKEVIYEETNKKFSLPQYTDPKDLFTLINIITHGSELIKIGGEEIWVIKTEYMKKYHEISNRAHNYCHAEKCQDESIRRMKELFNIEPWDKGG